MDKFFNTIYIIIYYTADEPDNDEKTTLAHGIYQRGEIGLYNHNTPAIGYGIICRLPQAGYNDTEMKREMKFGHDQQTIENNQLQRNSSNILEVDQVNTDSSDDDVLTQLVDIDPTIHDIVQPKLATVNDGCTKISILNCDVRLNHIWCCIITIFIEVVIILLLY